MPQLLEYNLSPCSKEEMSSTEIINERISDINLSSDTLRLTISTVMNCCSGEKAGFSLHIDTLYLFSDFRDAKIIYNDKGDSIGFDEPSDCECNCCFTLGYCLIGIDKIPAVIKMNNKTITFATNKFIVPSYELYNGDTLFSHDDQGFKYQYLFYDSCKLKMVKKYKGLYYNIKIYYESGSLKKEVEYYKDIDNATVKEFDENGSLINQIIPEKK